MSGETLPLPLLETPRLRLRPFQDSDLEDYYTLVYGDEAVMRYLPGGKARTLEQTRAVLDFAVTHGQQHGFTLWAVIRQQRQTVMSAAYAAHPERFIKGLPVVAAPPKDVWINPPALPNLP